MVITEEEIDLSKLENMCGKLVPGVTLELKLIEYFTLISSEDNNPIDKFTSYVLKYFYKDEIERPYHEITAFFKEKVYINHVMYFLDMVEIYLLIKFGPDVVNIKFLRYGESKEKLMGVFQIWKKD